MRYRKVAYVAIDLLIKEWAMTVEEFLLLYPVFSQSATTEQIAAKLRFADLMIDRIGAFGDMRYDALGLLTAHLLTLDKVAGSNGSSLQAKISKKVGEVQFTYAQSSQDREWYNLSKYGQQLLFLIDLLPKNSGAFVV